VSGTGVEFVARRAAESALALGNTYKGSLLNLSFGEKSSGGGVAVVKIEREDEMGGDVEDWKR
jgi:hypothetical protein